jgi:hypothetical protein
LECGSGSFGGLFTPVPDPNYAPQGKKVILCPAARGMHGDSKRHTVHCSLDCNKKNYFLDFFKFFTKKSFYFVCDEVSGFIFFCDNCRNELKTPPI